MTACSSRYPTNLNDKKSNIEINPIGSSSNLIGLIGWPTKMSKMKQGKTTENGKSLITPKCRNCFGELRKSVENLKYSALGAIC